MAPSGHALLAPSAAHRWLMCPASVPFGLQFPDGETSVYAEEGTLAHAAAECILEFESGAKPGPALDALQHGGWQDLLNGNVDRKGSDRIYNGVSWIEAPFLHFHA